MGIVFGAVVPHPPLLIPDVGRGQEQAVSATIQALRQLAQELARYQPQTLVVISPHGEGHADAMGVLTAPASRGSMRSWGSLLPDVSYPNDPELVRVLQEEAKRARIPLKSIGGRGYELDHGVMVPMHFLGEGAKGVPLVPLTFSWLPPAFHFAFGQALRLAAERVGRRVAVIASGDLSHRLIPTAPAGYDPQGKVFDEKVIANLKQMDREALLNLDPLLAERAGECGLRSILILLGALEGLAVSPRLLSYEGPFGVGYLVACFEIQGPQEFHPLVRLAKETAEGFIQGGKLPQPRELSPEMQGRAGVFVSIKKFGELRGCIGTFEPCHPNIAQEVIANAVNAACHDPRFYPISPEELPYLIYSVDVLSPPVPVQDRSQLDPKRYGIIVEGGGRRGLLLPDLAGVDTAEEQFLICCRKAGLSPNDPLTLYCFEVKRFK